MNRQFYCGAHRGSGFTGQSCSGPLARWNSFLVSSAGRAVLVPLLRQGAQGAQCLLSVLLSRAKYVVVHKRKRSKKPDLLVEKEVGLKGKRVECPAGDLWCWSMVWQMRSENPAALLHINSFFTGFCPSEPHCIS